MTLQNTAPFERQADVAHLPPAPVRDPRRARGSRLPRTYGQPPPLRAVPGCLMTRNEARIFTSIWRDDDFVALPASAQRLYLFLLSQDDMTYCGVLPLRERRWAAKSAGMTLADIERDLKTLEGTAYPSANPFPDRAVAPFVIVDRETEEVFVRSLLRRDGIWKQPNLLKPARDSAEQIESPHIRAGLLAELRRLPLEESGSEQVRRVVAEFIADLEKGKPYPSAYPSPNPSDNPDPDPSGNGDGNPPENPSADPSQGKGDGYGLLVGVPPTPDPGSPDPTDLPARDRKRGTRLSDDFTVTPAMVAWFREHCPHVDGKRETEQFRDYWRAKPGKDGCKLDWTATWRQWMRTAEQRAGPRVRGTPSQPRSTTDERVAGAQALKAEFADQHPPRET